MHAILHRPRRAVLAGILVLSSGGVLAATASPDASGPASCEIRSSNTGDTIELTALARADENISGSYAFRVTGAGTSINQGGAFKAAPGRAATLGTVRLGANGTTYKAALDITVDGATVSCSKRVGGA